VVNIDFGAMCVLELTTVAVAVTISVACSHDVGCMHAWKCSALSGVHTVFALSSIAPQKAVHVSVNKSSRGIRYRFTGTSSTTML